MPFLQRDRRKIYYVIDQARGRNRAETVILLHTNITDHTLYDRIVPYLTEDYNVVRFDLPGLGKSDLGGDTISLDTYVADLRYVIEALALEEVYLVGIGFGGMICLEYSALYRDSVKKMVLLTLPCFPEATLPVVQKHRRAISKDGHVVPADSLIKKTTTLALLDPEYERLHGIMKRTNPAVYTTLMNLTVSGRTLDYLAKNTTPALILAGDKEVVFPQDLLARSALDLPNIQYSVIPNASSFVMVDQPEITAQLIREFLKSEPQIGRFTDHVSYAIEADVRRYTQRIHNQTRSAGLNRLQIDLLYSFRVSVNGHPVPHGWNQRYAKQILAYLLFHPMTTREELCENVWPDTPLTTARSNLRVYLAHLKKILQAHALAEPILVVDREHVSLHADVSSDALHFVSDVQWAMSATNEHQKFERILSILGQLTTSQYLTAIHDSWFVQMRWKLEQDVTYLASWAFRWLVATGHTEAAQHFLKTAVLVLDDDEALYALLGTA